MALTWSTSQIDDFGRRLATADSKTLRDSILAEFSANLPNLNRACEHPQHMQLMEAVFMAR